MGRMIALTFGVSLLVSPVWAEAPETSPRPAERSQSAAPVTQPFDEFLQEFGQKAIEEGLSPAIVTPALQSARFLPDVIRLDRNQNEFTMTIWDYLDTAVSATRVQNGRAALARNQDALEDIERMHGVPKEIVVAIWGLESSYGAFRGNTSTLSALATLAADSRRSDFFSDQLMAALRILDDGETNLSAMQGSWAGAMGHTQFMPTSFLEHAQDYDGDGRRNIWGDDPRDALASTAAYLKANGWITGQPAAMEVTLPPGFNYRLTGERIEKPAADWMAFGVRLADGGDIPDRGLASIRVPGGHEGAAFVTYENFRVLETYNTADAYVIAVAHLADRIAGGPALKSGWPRQDRSLSFDERVEMQTLLQGKGFDPEKLDGRVGPLTLEAIQQWQEARGLVPDGYMDPDLLARLRGE